MSHPRRSRSALSRTTPRRGALLWRVVCEMRPLGRAALRAALTLCRVLSCHGFALFSKFRELNAELAAEWNRYSPRTPFATCYALCVTRYALRVTHYAPRTTCHTPVTATAHSS